MSLKGASCKNAEFWYLRCLKSGRIYHQNLLEFLVLANVTIQAKVSCQKGPCNINIGSQNKTQPFILLPPNTIHIIALKYLKARSNFFSVIGRYLTSLVVCGGVSKIECKFQEHFYFEICATSILFFYLSVFP